MSLDRLLMGHDPGNVRTDSEGSSRNHSSRNHLLHSTCRILDHRFFCQISVMERIEVHHMDPLRITRLRSHQVRGQSTSCGDLYSRQLAVGQIVIFHVCCAHFCFSNHCIHMLALYKQENWTRSIKNNKNQLPSCKQTTGTRAGNKQFIHA